jgi:hypothetical protein
MKITKERIAELFSIWHDERKLDSLEQYELFIAIEERDAALEEKDAKIERLRELTTWACEHCADAPCTDCDNTGTCLYFKLNSESGE